MEAEPDDQRKAQRRSRHHESKCRKVLQRHTAENRAGGQRQYPTHSAGLGVTEAPAGDNRFKERRERASHVGGGDLEPDHPHRATLDSHGAGACHQEEELLALTGIPRNADPHDAGHRQYQPLNRQGSGDAHRPQLRLG